VRMTADRLVSMGLAAAGYTYLSIDGEGGKRDTCAVFVLVGVWAACSPTGAAWPHIVQR
jgi:hypothetical protein